LTLTNAAVKVYTTHTAAPSDRVIEIVDYSATWPVLFADLGTRLRRALGDVALRIDHIGSTSVPGLAAKPVIDVQISVADFEPLDAFRAPLCDLGFVYRADNTERTKRYFREPSGQRRTHIHVRRAGSFSEQFPLLFRDYLRAYSDDAAAYDRLKGAWPLSSRTTALPTPMRRSPSRGRSFAGLTAGPNASTGRQVHPTPDTLRLSSPRTTTHHAAKAAEPGPPMPSHRTLCAPLQFARSALPLQWVGVRSSSHHHGQKRGQ
jgi:GrpB-like predicted nucleotidyltransferase (UPF0157 family)